ncbi:acid phosphatase [Rhizobium leguminosarum]|nr:acid phosphatase [Rhizobium leguminosarum]
MRKPQIEITIRTEIDNLLARSGKQFASGASQSSLSIALEAWDLIPEPKEA